MIDHNGFGKQRLTPILIWKQWKPMGQSREVRQGPIVFSLMQIPFNHLLGLLMHETLGTLSSSSEDDDKELSPLAIGASPLLVHWE